MGTRPAGSSVSGIIVTNSISWASFFAESAGGLPAVTRSKVSFVALSLVAIRRSTARLTLPIEM